MAFCTLTIFCFRESLTFAQVKKTVTHFRYLLFFLMVPAMVNAQGIPGQSGAQKNALTFNLGQYLVNEINLGYEHFFSEKKSMELSGGMIYRNDFWIKQAGDWSNSQYFYERGFAVRLAYKIYRKAGEKKGRKNYYAAGLNYQYLYFPNEWFDAGEVNYSRKIPDPASQGDSITLTGTGVREIYQHRFRNRFGLQLLLGNIYPLGNTFALEIFYGIGVRGIFSNRFDVAVHEDYTGASKDGNVYKLDNTYVSGNEDSKFYIRPSIHAGIKLRLGW